MQEVVIIFGIITYFLFIFTLTYYLATNLQWYNYSFLRVLTKHHKVRWHFYYFVIPIIFYLVLVPLDYELLFYVYFYCVALPLFFLWYRSLDKKLVWTKRIIRLFIIVFLFAIVNESLVFFVDWGLLVERVFSLLSLCLGFVCAMLCEVALLNSYAKIAKAKIEELNSLIVIAITGSYGKTSTKNFITQILQQHFRVYATPKSVNTYKGLVADINKNLCDSYDIYVAEAGARNKGDIEEISSLLQQHYGVIGKIGQAHIEYFKNIQTTASTKFEMLYSNRLIQAFVQKDNEIPADFKECFAPNLQKITQYPPEITILESTLQKTRFSMVLDSELLEFETSVLGRFNVDNIVVAILLAKKLGMQNSLIQRAVKKLVPVAHRLQRIDTPNKLILDDSFNGNLEGMSEAIRLSALHEGRKVIVTPGLIEHDEQSNILLAQQINDVFDLVIITGDLNASLLDAHIQKPEKIILKDKTQLETILAQSGKNNDLVLFANDAPSYI